MLCLNRFVELSPDQHDEIKNQIIDIQVEKQVFFLHFTLLIITNVWPVWLILHAKHCTFSKSVLTKNHRLIIVGVLL